ncbi:MAG: bifunctional folylpolyglutamate synthase/dihydrofolate synthase [Spirochaetales bacterium]|nr:bifunctional folylpolyglutamate synthase/dihydrofolate synthase [Spirochaetales bacterium]
MIKIHNSLEAFQFIESFRNFEKTAQFSNRHFRLDRMEKLLEIFNDPQKNYKIFHIAGTKGKGSTALFLSLLLKNSGFITGLYTSPHVTDYRERIQVQNEYADPLLITDLTQEIARNIETLTFRPTTFELLTLLGFLYFREMKCDYAVIETGLGGRLDATNIVKPLASIITPIDIEHTEFLGETLEAIAAEKAGIIKDRTPVFSSSQDPRVKTVLLQKAALCQSPFYLLEDEIIIFPEKSSYTAQTCLFQFTKSNKAVKTTIKMLGDFQRENAALAALVFNHFFPEKTFELLPHAYAQVSLPGRMEILSNKPVVLIDGAHTINSIKRLMQNFKEFHGGPRSILLFGCLAGKKAREMMILLKDSFDFFIITYPSDLRKTDLNEIAEVLESSGKNYIIEKDTEKAIITTKKRLNTYDNLVVTGSFYLIGRFKKLFTDSGPIE